MMNSFNLSEFSYAHRGLWDEAAPENSAEAFRFAVQAGLGAECDVHLSRDGVPVVHHDNNLVRMTGHDARIGELDIDEITALTLIDTKQTVPTLSDVLKIMDKLPLLVELKIDEFTNLGIIHEPERPFPCAHEDSRQAFRPCRGHELRC